MSTTLYASSASELLSLLKNCTGGETILLEGGDYGDVLIKGLSFDSAVTITSADPSDPAVFTGFRAIDINGLSIDRVTFDYQFEAGDPIHTTPFSVMNSSNISITNSVFDGDVATGVSSIADGYGYGSGLKVSGSSDIIIENNEFYDFHRGLLVSNTEDVQVLNNDIHDMRMDGMNFAAVQGALIEGNYIHDFKTSPNSDDHSDMIQFWTKSQTTPNTDIIIRDNILDVGDGGTTQSIFMRNEEVDQGNAGEEMYYQNILIENNTIYNAHRAGITIGATDGLTIRDNTVLQAVGSDSVDITRAVNLPTINVNADSQNVTVAGNITGGVSSVPAGGDWTVSGNLIVQNTQPNGANYYGDIFIASSLTADADGSHHYVLKPGTGSYGSIETQYGVSDDLSAVFDVGVDASATHTLVFDASIIFDQAGDSLPEGTSYLWEFGDGTQAEGLVVSHKFSEHGTYTAVLTVTLPDGTVLTTEANVLIADSTLVAFDGATGQLVSGDTDATTAIVATKENLSSVSTSGTVAGLDLGASGVTATVGRNDISTLFGTDNMDLSFTLQSDKTGSGAGEVFRLHGSFVARVDAKGNLTFTLTSSDGASTKIASTGVNFLDGTAHTVDISYDGQGNTLTLVVDGISMGSVAAGDALAGAGTVDLTFGNPWGQTNFDGHLLDFQLDVQNSPYAEYTGDLTSVSSESSAAAAKPVVPEETVSLPPVHEEAGAGQDTSTSGTEDLPVRHDTGSDPISDTPTINAGHGGTSSAVLSSGVFDDFVLDIAALGDLSSLWTRGGISVGDVDGQAALRYEGGVAAVNLGRQTQFESSDQIAFSVDFSRDEADGSTGRLVWNHMKIGLALKDDGLVIYAGTADQGFKTFIVKDLGLNDTENHNIQVYADADSDILQVYVDDALVLEETQTDLDFVGAGGYEWGWMLGNPWNSTFDGSITGFSIDDDFTLSHSTSEFGV